MDSQPIPLPRTSAPTVDISAQLDQYRGVVSALFADHQRLDRDGQKVCSCGKPCPCASEQLAARLLDWVS